jgi:hypothetical protein
VESIDRPFLLEDNEFRDGFETTVGGPYRRIE